MNNYELMVILTPVLSEEDFKAAQKKYTDFITEAGGSIVHSNPWGLKSLAYPVEYTALSSFNEKFKIQLLRDDQVMRHMITVLDKYAVEYNSKKQRGVPTGTEKLARV